jgi:hypothetical protein
MPTMSDTPASEPAAPPAPPRLAFTEGSITLPAGYEDRTNNLLVPANTQTQANLSIARDTMKPGETLPAYIDRQIASLKSQLPGHKVIARKPVLLGAGDTAPAGERIDATYRNGRHLIHQRQAAFAFDGAAGRVLIFSASSLTAFDAEQDAQWTEWLASYAPAPLPQPDTAAADAADSGNADPDSGAPDAG